MPAKSKIPTRDAVNPRESRATPAAPRPRAGLLSETAGLQLLVFVAGAVLMGLEIVGSRVLAPYFGNSVFVWGSLISLFLMALSLGYYFGGRVADRHPSQAWLSGILIVVALSIFAVAAIARPVCSAVLGLGLGEQLGPLLAAAILFLLPSVGMGMASPYAVRLAASTVHSVGRTAGTLYALSTVGSIAGTMLTTFVLIPMIGAGAILKGLAAALLAIGVVTFPFASVGGATVAALAAAVATAAGMYFISEAQAALQPGAKLIYDANTPYHHISVVDGAAGQRELRFDRFVESKIEIAPPYRSDSGYTYYFHLAFLAQPKINRALFIGAGGGVGPRSFLMHNPDMEIDVVDIDAKVLEVARDYFFMTDQRRTRSITADGRAFVRSAKPGSYDAIVLDAFTIGGRIPFHLVSREFIELCRDRLAPGGVFVMNINSAEAGSRGAIYRSMFKTIDSAFDGAAQAFVLGRRDIRPTQSTNVILVAVRDGQPLSEAQWRERAAAYASPSYIEGRHIERMIDDLAPRPDVADAPLFTDDFAPIETMSFE